MAKIEIEIPVTIYSDAIVEGLDFDHDQIIELFDAIEERVEDLDFLERLALHYVERFNEQAEGVDEEWYPKMILKRGIS